jgi:hypothetical protein
MLSFRSVCAAVFIIAAVPLLNGCSTCALCGKKSIALFDGKTLDGWQQVSAEPGTSIESVWMVKGGLLKCSGTPIGALYKGPEVTDFRMVVEYRWAPGKAPGNSGIFSRIETPVTPLPRAIEVQLKHGDAGHVFGLQGKPVASGQPRYMEVKAHAVAGDISGVKHIESAEKPPGEWNKVEILAEGGRYRVWMNGKLVNDATGVSISRGMAGVQSEGGEIHFRKVQLTPLSK